MFAAKNAGGDRKTATLTAVSLLAIYQIGWNYNQAFTHSCALIGATALFWSALSTLIRDRSVSAYLLLGVTVGFLLLAKYVAWGTLAAAGVAMLSLKEARPVLGDRRVILHADRCRACRVTALCLARR